MKKYIKPEVTFFLLMEELSICANSPLTVDHSSTHGSSDEHGNPDLINEGYGGEGTTVPVEDDEDGEWDSMSKKQSIWDW